MANRRRTDLMVVHVTATPPSWNKGAKAIDAIHKGMGWRGIGYNEVIKRDGTLEMGRGLEAIGAHVAGFNSVSYGIAMVGGVDAKGRPDNNMTLAQFETLERRLKELSKRWPKAKVCGHRDLSPDRDGDGLIEPHEYMKSCPCFDAIPWAAQRGLPPADIKGTWAMPDGTPEGPDTRNAYLQRLLVKAGYQFGPVDGIIGPRTKTAIRAYQKAHGLKSTGTFNDETVAKLRAQFEAQKVQSAIEEMADAFDAEIESETQPKPSKVPSSIIAAIGALIAAIAAAFGGDAINIISKLGG